MSQKTVSEKSRTRGKATVGSASSIPNNVPSSPVARSPTRSPHKAHGAMDDSALAQILARLDRMELRMDDSIGEVKSMAGETATEVARLSVLLVNSSQEREKDRRSLRIVNHDLKLTRQSNKLLAERVNELENNAKICNIRLDGKEEDETEDLKAYMTDLITFLSPTGVGMSDIGAAYRIGKKLTNHTYTNQATSHRNAHIATRPRSIMIIFKSVLARNAFYFSRAKLNKTERYAGIYLNDDVTQITRKCREEFRSVAVLARSSGAEVRVHSDGIVIDGHKFKHAATLPEKFSLSKAKTVEMHNELYFHSEHSFLSNFHPSPISDDNTVYPTAEHCFQAAKCRLANDKEKLDQVLNAQTPMEAKRIAEPIPESAEWRHSREAILTGVIDQKFDQNPVLADMLVATGHIKLNEATNNTYYGVGATLHSRALRDRSYRGINKLGQVLAAKRDSIRADRSQNK